MKHCPKCCPKRQPGRPLATVRHELEPYGDEPGVWAWKCWNCGHVKKPRNTGKRTDWKWVTEEAPTADKMNRRDAIRFHAFNPNGMLAQLRQIHERVADVVERTGVPNGVLFVHGSLNDFPRKRIFELLDVKRPTRSQTHVALSMCADDIRDAEKWISETLAKHGLEPGQRPTLNEGNE